MKFGNENVETEIFTESEMSADLDNFHLKESLTVQLNDETFFEKSWESSIPRIFVWIFARKFLSLCQQFSEKFKI